MTSHDEFYNEMGAEMSLNVINLKNNHVYGDETTYSLIWYGKLVYFTHYEKTNTLVFTSDNLTLEEVEEVEKFFKSYLTNQENVLY